MMARKGFFQEQRLDAFIGCVLELMRLEKEVYHATVNVDIINPRHTVYDFFERPKTQPHKGTLK